MNEHSIHDGPKTDSQTFVSNFANSFTGAIVSKFPILAHRQNNAASTVECDCLIA